MIVLDTTVLVYATGGEHALRESCAELVRAIGDGRLAAATTIEVIQELTHVRAQRRTRADAATLARDYIELLSPLISPTEDELRLGLSLFERHRSLGAFDSVLAAAAISRHAQALVSADRAFSNVRDLRHTLPDARGAGSLL